MAKTLGLDLGTNSIGWAILDADISDSQVKYKGIFDSGVRIFPEGSNDIGKKEEQSKNATRTEHRQGRRQTYRRKLRRAKLLQVLISQGMCPLSEQSLEDWYKWDKEKKTEGKVFPSEPEFVEWLKMNPYELRHKALKEDITLHEFGRILYHIIHHRGFLSSRKGGADEDNSIFKGTDGVKGINETNNLIENTTLGDAMYKIMPKDNDKYKQNRERIRNRYTQRLMYIEEFQKIWERQADQLGISDKEVEVSKLSFLTGNANNKRNTLRIERYKREYEKVEINGKIVTLVKKVKLKELLGGVIKNEDGKLTFSSHSSVLFWQRQLRSQKGLLSNCTFERGKKPSPKSHPDFELYRAYQFINNIRYGKGKRLTEDQRNVVLGLIKSEKSAFMFSEIPKELSLTHKRFNYEADFKVAGSPTISQLSELFPKEVWNDKKIEIWNCFHSYDDNSKLFTKLKTEFELISDEPSDIDKIRLAEDYSSISHKAIKNINYFLKRGNQYSDAVLLGGIKNAFGSRWEYFEIDDFVKRLEYDVKGILMENNKEDEAIEKIKAYLADDNLKYGFKENDPAFKRLYHHSQEIETKELKDLISTVDNLRNPIVQKCLNEMRRLVNNLLITNRKTDKDFKFDRINVELGRELKNSKTKRRDLTKQNKNREAENSEIVLELQDLGVRPNKGNILSLKLFRELLAQSAGVTTCPYTGRSISLASLYDGSNSFQIEHIIPRSTSLDDSFANKTLCESKFNQLKGNKTPYEFYKQNSDPKLWGVSSWEDVKQRAFRLLPYIKAKRFVNEKQKDEKEFISRQLNDTRYISKKAVEILSEICPNVRSLPGQLTAELRYLWGVNNILNPVYGAEEAFKDSVETKRVAYHAILNEDREVLEFVRKNNAKPSTKPNQIVIGGNVKDHKFTSRYMSLTVEAPDLNNGRYWIVLDVSEPKNISPIFNTKPSYTDQSIVLKGRVNKEKFKTSSFSKAIDATGENDGAYWASIGIKGREFKPADKKQKSAGSKLALFGEVKDGEFNCHIYNCESNLPDGKYWLVLDLAFSDAELTRIKNQKPEIDNNQIITESSVDEDGVISLDIDTSYSAQTELNKGRYYCTLDITKTNNSLYAQQNPAPKPSKKQIPTEIVAWVDKSTGEIRYEPKKNREDNRHHALDAVIIALTEQGHIQELNTYFAKEEKAQHGAALSQRFELPWEGFVGDAEKAMNNILISFTQDKRVLSSVSKMIFKNGRKHQSKGLAVRGQLHEETVYGKRKAPNDEKDYFHVRKPITFFKTGKRISKIVDIALRDLIEKHLRKAFDNIIPSDPKKRFDYKVPDGAFFKDGKPRIFLPNRRGGEPVPVLKVRMKENLGKAIQIKNNVNKFVNPRNNHHVIIYENHEGKLAQKSIQFIEAVERKRSGHDVYQLPEDGKRIVCTLHKTEMFLLGLPEGIEISSQNKEYLSKYLYRVQEISDGDYTFRHHLASTKNNANEKCRIRSMKGWEAANPIKVMIDSIGNISLKQ